VKGGKGRDSHVRWDGWFERPRRAVFTVSISVLLHTQTAHKPTAHRPKAQRHRAHWCIAHWCTDIGRAREVRDWIIQAHSVL